MQTVAMGQGKIILKSFKNRNSKKKKKKWSF